MGGHGTIPEGVVPTLALLGMFEGSGFGRLTADELLTRLGCAGLIIGHSWQINHCQVNLVLAVDRQEDGHVNDWQILSLSDFVRDPLDVRLNVTEIVYDSVLTFWHVLVSDCRVIMVFGLVSTPELELKGCLCDTATAFWQVDPGNILKH